MATSVTGSTGTPVATPAPLPVATTGTSTSRTTGTGTGRISSAGIGSGLDVETIVTKLMAVEQAPLNLLKAKASSIQTTISAFGSVQSTLSNFRDAARSLTGPGAWSQMTATSGDTSAISVSTATGAVAANYAVGVTNLAAAQSTVSSTYASGSALVGAGSLHIDIAGTSGFGGAPGGGVDVTTTATDTLQSLAEKINAASGGISAAVVTDTTGARLVLTASKTGVENRFRVAGSGGLADLSFDPSAPSSGATTLTQAAADAHATINGLTLTSASNTLQNVVPGLTINLLKQTSSPVQVGVAQDAAALKTTIKGFADAYNSLATLLATDVKYDAETKTAGPLQADSAAVTLQRQLRNILGSSSGASPTFATLSSIGLQVQTDGTLKVNDATLTNALGNSGELKKAFAALSNGAIDANSGFAQQFRKLADAAIGATGTLTSRVAGLNSSLTRNTSDQSKMQDRLAQTEARMRAQYNALDTKMASISTLGTYISQQIANWNKNPS